MKMNLIGKSFAGVMCAKSNQAEIANISIFRANYTRGWCRCLIMKIILKINGIKLIEINYVLWLFDILIFAQFIMDDFFRRIKYTKI